MTQKFEITIDGHETYTEGEVRRAIAALRGDEVVVTENKGN